MQTRLTLALFHSAAPDDDAMVFLSREVVEGEVIRVFSVFMERGKNTGQIKTYSCARCQGGRRGRAVE